jgi:hypothetical protein
VGRTGGHPLTQVVLTGGHPLTQVGRTGGHTPTQVVRTINLPASLHCLRTSALQTILSQRLRE